MQKMYLLPLLKEIEIALVKIFGCLTYTILGHNTLETKCCAISLISLISLSFVNIEVLFVSTEHLHTEPNDYILMAQLYETFNSKDQY